MEIRFIAKNLADTSGINNLLANQPQPVWVDGKGNEHLCPAQWTGPTVRSGLFDTPAEWILALNIAALPANVAAALLTNYLWSLIQRGRGQSSQDSSHEKRPPFHDIPSATMVVTKQEKRTEIDPLRVELRNLEASVEDLFDEKDSDKIHSD